MSGISGILKVFLALSLERLVHCFQPHVAPLHATNRIKQRTEAKENARRNRQVLLLLN